MKNKYIFVIIVIFLLSFSSQSQGNKNTIAAIVNGNYVIFDYDITEQKIYLSITNKEQWNILSKNKNINNLLLNRIIETYLIKLEANKYSISLTNDELESGLRDLTKNLKISKPDLQKLIIKKGLDYKKFISLLKDDILVEKLKQIMAFSRSNTPIEEIEAETNKLLNLNGKVEFLLYEISIVNINQKYAQQKLSLLKNNLTVNNFSQWAKKISDGLNGTQGGLIGWVPQDYLPNEILAELMTIKPNSISKPILIGNTYKVIYLKEARPLLTINPNDPSHMQQLNAYAKQKVAYDKSQISLEDFMKEMYQSASIQIYNEQK